MTSEKTGNPDVVTVAKETVVGLVVVASLTVTLCAAVVWRVRSTSNETASGTGSAGDVLVVTTVPPDPRQEGPVARDASSRPLDAAAIASHGFRKRLDESDPSADRGIDRLQIQAGDSRLNDAVAAERPSVATTASATCDLPRALPRPTIAPRPIDIPPPGNLEPNSPSLPLPGPTATNPNRLATASSPSPSDHVGGRLIRPTSGGQATSLDDSFVEQQRSRAPQRVGPGASFDEPSPTVIQPAASDPVYTVQPNDSYWTISMSVYGKGGYFKALIAHNAKNHSGPRQLTVGDKVLTPPWQYLMQHYSALCPVDVLQ